MIGAIVDELAPSLVARNSIGQESAAQLLLTAGDNSDRIASEASFAALCGVSPVPASSGKVTRHRLNRGGDRAANSALHIIAIGRLRTDPRTKAYVARRMAEGHSKLEAHSMPEAIHRPRGLHPDPAAQSRDRTDPNRRLTNRRASVAWSTWAPTSSVRWIVQASAKCESASPEDLERQRAHESLVQVHEVGHVSRPRSPASDQALRSAIASYVDSTTARDYTHHSDTEHRSSSSTHVYN